MMGKVARHHLAIQIVHWLLIILIAGYLITGFGITEYKVVESLTFGLLTRNLAFRIHGNLWIPLVLLLLLHIFQRVVKKR